MTSALHGKSTRKPSAQTPSPQKPLARAAARPKNAQPAVAKLLHALAEPGACATPSETDDGRLDVFSSRNGVSLRTGIAPAAAAKALIAQDLARWESAGASGRKRLVLSEAGLARLARMKAGDGADPFFSQHRPVGRRDVRAGGSVRSVAFDQAESPLAWLAKRKNANGQAMISPAMLEAGERLRRDLTFAQMMPRVTANWDPSLAGGDRHSAPLTYSDAVIAARQRADHAFRAVGPEFAGLLMDVCGFLKGLELVETERGWPRRSAKLVLNLALAALARHYGLAYAAHGLSAAKRVRHWGTDDFRPAIGPLVQD